MHLEPGVENHFCPKCGMLMEPIKCAADLPLQQLELCPGCYRVRWRDQYGFHTGQGVPMKAMVEQVQ